MLAWLARDLNPVSGAALFGILGVTIHNFIDRVQIRVHARFNDVGAEPLAGDHISKVPFDFDRDFPLRVFSDGDGLDQIIQEFGFAADEYIHQFISRVHRTTAGSLGAQNFPFKFKANGYLRAFAALRRHTQMSELINFTTRVAIRATAWSFVRSWIPPF